MANIPSFHDGYFDGKWIGPDKLAHLFLRTIDEQSFVSDLEGVQALTLTEIKQDNIILDLVFRRDTEITSSDIEHLYGIDADKRQVMMVLETAKERGLQLLEINASYGGQGSVLFQTWALLNGQESPYRGCPITRPTRALTP